MSVTKEAFQLVIVFHLSKCILSCKCNSKTHFSHILNTKAQPTLL